MGGLDENSSPLLNSLLPVGSPIWGGLGGTTLLKKVSHWG